MNRQQFLRMGMAAALWGIGGRQARAATASPLVRWRLANGLSVLCFPRPGLPLATVQIYYRAGSRYEKAGQRGLARMMEGLMWKGSRQVPSDAHARFIRQVGGQVGAFTTEDLTGFHQIVPPAYVDFALQLEAERMRNLVFFPSMVAARQQELLAERTARVDENPIGRALEVFRGLAFGSHPYGWTTLGAAADLRAVGVDDCRTFYDRHYQPAHAVVVVAGAVDPDVVRRSVQDRFGDIAGGDADSSGRPAPFSPPPDATSLKRHLRLPIAQPVAVVGFHTPPAGHEDHPALDVLVDLVAGGPNAFAWRRLVDEKGLATQVGGANRALASAGLLATFATCAPDVDSAGVAQHLQTALITAVDAPDLDRRLAVAKARTLVAAGRDNARVDGLAVQLALSELVAGRADLHWARMKRLSSLTAADLRRVAARHFKPDNVLLLSVQPERAAVPSGRVPSGAGESPS